MNVKNDFDLSKVRFNADGLIAAVAQEKSTKDVLMLAWMNAQALQLTLETGFAVYYSRSRQALWRKGEASGHQQQVHAVHLDCDGDAVLLEITQHGHDPSIACHTGRHSCFYQTWQQGAWQPNAPVLKDPSTIYSS